MDKKKSQLNVQIDPELLIALKTEAIKSGKTLTTFVTDLLQQYPDQSENEEVLEQRLLRIEEKLDLLRNFTNDLSVQKIPSISIFSDFGAKKYGIVARELFEFHRKKKKLSLEDAIEELFRCLANYDGDTELVFKILTGAHELTGLEMTKAYRNGSCGMRSALTEWTKSSLEPLNKAFLNAVDVKSLV